MKKPIYSAIAASLALSLAACGGGGGDTASTANDSALQGVWISSTDNHPTGGACGLDIHGAWGKRVTLTFNADGSYAAKSEVCVSLVGGNTGAYFQNNSTTATYVTGGVYLDGGSPALDMKSLDISISPTFYTAYNITGNQLKLGVASVANDGSTPAKRAYEFQSLLDPVYLKQ